MDLRIEPFLEIGNTEFIIRLLKNNAGISFLPEFSIKNEISAGHLAVLPVKDFHMHIWRQILYHKDKWVTREMDAFIRLAQEAPLSPFFALRLRPPATPGQGDQKEKAADSDGQIVASGEIIKFSKPGIKGRHQKSPKHGHIGIGRPIILALPEQLTEQRSHHGGRGGVIP